MSHTRTAHEPAQSQTDSPRTVCSAGPVSPQTVLQRLEEAPGSLRRADVLQLQRAIGNRATGQLIQAKLKLGPAGDRYEQEADSIAKQVVRASRQPQIQRERADEEEIQAKPLADSIKPIQRAFVSPPKVQREETDDELMQASPLPGPTPDGGKPKGFAASSVVQRHHGEEEVQASPNHGMEGGDVDADVARSIQSARGGGRPLHDGVRSSMERGFGADFSGVRVHTGGQADALNRSLNARAFTTGSDIFFGQGQYNPGSTGGQELIAHELTHTVQQGAAQVQTKVQKKGQGERQQAVEKRQSATTVQRRENQSSLARIVNVGVNVKDARGNLGQLGHAMDVWVDIDAGEHPVTPPNAKPNTVYGLEFEYWEYVDVPHDNLGATGVKPWNDIHGIKPDASTFDVAADGCDMTWKAAVSAAAAGTLTGRKRIGFRDIPGLFEKATRNVERTLKFRIVFNDGAQRREIFATQLLRVDNGRLGYSAYTDSVGNNLESHGFGADTYVKGSQAEQQALGTEAGKLAMDGSALPTLQQVVSSVPQGARQEVQTFVRELMLNQSDPFLDKEMAEFVSKVPTDKQERTAPQDWVNTISQKFMTDAPGVAAGQYLIPNIPGTQRKQKTVPGGLLVAIVTGNNIQRMYFTDNTLHNVSMNIVPQLATKNWTINLRSFTEIPTNHIQDSLDNYRTTSIVSTVKNAPLNAPNAHLRGFTQRGNNYIVNVRNSVGNKIKRNNQVSIVDPEVRDITGQWLKASFGGVNGFIRADKIAGTQDANAWKEAQKGTLPEVMPHKVMELNDADHLRQLAQANVGNHPNLLATIVAYMHRYPGRKGTIEELYDSEIPKLNIAVPATLGMLAYGQIKAAFQAQGDGFAIYRNVRQQYPEFDYLVKPAYRELFGDTRLKQMLGELRTDEFAQDVPNPNAPMNQLDRLLFEIGGPYTIQNFVPSTGIGKFDAQYDPATGFLDIILKVNFDWVDYTGSKELAGGREKPLHIDYLRDKWEQSAKQPWIDLFKQKISQIWDAKFRMRCIRPGWNGIVATPRMQIREVPDGQQHFKIKVDKATLVNDQGTQKLTTQGGSSNVDTRTMIAQLREFDLVDKIADPSVHEYLHEGEAKHVKNAYKTDRDLLASMLAQFGAIEYRRKTTGFRDPAKVRNLIDAIKQTKITSSLAHLHPIVLETSTDSVPSDRRLAARRARLLKMRLAQDGIRNPVSIKQVSGTFNGIVAKNADPDPQVEAAFIRNWNRISAAHEFGHMIGLVDEYNPAASTEMVRKMVSDGLLPPNTPGQHLTGKGTSYASGQGEKQAGFARLLEETNLSAPNFDPTKGAAEVMSTSLMTSGYEVMAQHFVTFWEALVTMTGAHLDRKYWEIV